MLNLILSPFRKIYLYLAAAGAAIIALLAYGRINKTKGREELLQEQIVSDEEKRIKGREAAFEEQRKTDGLSYSDVVDRLRRRRDDWGSL